jgi:hypothetical protein
MDNFVCWRCEREARGAFMLMGRLAAKWLVERQRQMQQSLTADGARTARGCSRLDFFVLDSVIE